MEVDSNANGLKVARVSGGRLECQIHKGPNISDVENEAPNPPLSQIDNWNNVSNLKEFHFPKVFMLFQA
jgi:hypothetical protein